MSTIIGIYTLLIWLPSYALEIRRAHDIGKSGILIIISMILSAGSWISNFFSVSLIGDPDILLAVIIFQVVLGIVILIMMIIPGNTGFNEYGPDPKGTGKEIEEENEPILSEEVISDEIRFCRECGKPLESGNTFCRFCGKKII